MKRTIQMHDMYILRNSTYYPTVLESKLIYFDKVMSVAIPEEQ